MKIVGCDLHTRYQQIAMLEQETGEFIERRLEHESGEARAFYAALSGPVRVGIEATGHARWFERMLAELGHELWIGDAAQIRASVVVGGTKRPPQDSESGPWSHEQSNTKSNSNTKTFHEEESQNLSRVHASLDNADTVIEGGPDLSR
jgi:hypothetical protein